MKQEEIEKRKKILDIPAGNSEHLMMENSTQFEHKITYLGAGAIAAILVFAEKNECYTWLLIVGLVILLFSCIMNLCSFVWYNGILQKEYNLFREVSYGLQSINNPGISKYYYKKHKKYIDLSEAEFHKFVIDIVQKRNKKSHKYNMYNLIILILGLCVISIYVGLNLNK